MKLAGEVGLAAPRRGGDEFEIQFADIFEQSTAFAAARPINVVNPDALLHRRWLQPTDTKAVEAPQ